MQEANRQEANEQAANEQETRKQENEKQKTRKKVLIADDEEVIADTLAIILGRAGFEARAVYSGEKAVEAAESFEPEMLITDVVMAGITGIEAAIRVRERLPKCKILLFSGQAATVDLLAEAHSQGYEFEILAKPVHPADLLARLRNGDASEESLTAEAGTALAGNSNGMRRSKI
jgi:DNA-binding NtrC family response regulator